MVAALLARAVAPSPSLGWLGVSLADVGGTGVPGVRIETVLIDSPAATAGLRSGDVIRAIRAQPIRRPNEVTETVRRTPPGTTLDVRVERAGATLDLAVAIAARPADIHRRFEHDRDEWQRPDQVIALLGIDTGAHVADIGAGGGYFTERLAAAVGPGGRVIAVDVDGEALAQLTTRFAGARNVVVQRGLPADPRLDAHSLDAVLMVDVLHEVADAAAMLAAIHRALGAGGRLVVVDRPAAEYAAGAHAIPEARVVSVAAEAGFRVRGSVDLPRQFALVLE